jgi:hypothetical protein
MIYRAVTYKNRADLIARDKIQELWIAVKMPVLKTPQKKHLQQKMSLLNFWQGGDGLH